MGSDALHFTGGWQIWVVPDKVTQLVLTLNGGSASGRAGGQVTGVLPVTPGQRLYVAIGGQGGTHTGTTGGPGGWPGGGHGGNGRGHNGGNGGGGVSMIRDGSLSGTLLCAAGGAAGDSGDAGHGGRGGGANGEGGSNGTDGAGATGLSTGGTTTQGGNGGTSSVGTAFNGGNASDSVLSAGANGGSVPSGHSGNGGGGGGCGWRGGGGGQASETTFAPGGGGGGGSSYIGSLQHGATTLGGSGSTDGELFLSWADAPGDRPPPPSGLTPASGTATKQVSSVTAHATVTGTGLIRLEVRYTTHSNFSSYQTAYSDWVAPGSVAAAVMSGLVVDSHYYVRAYTVDYSSGLRSITFGATDFFTDRRPNPPTLTAPADNAEVSPLDSVVFTWTPNDPDPASPQADARIKFWPADDPGHFFIRVAGTAHTYTANPGDFADSTFYLWSVHTKDGQGLWGDYAEPRQFFCTGNSAPPRPIMPTGAVAQPVDVPTVFSWSFVDPQSDDFQDKADIRWRLTGQDDSSWITTFGDTTTPGGTSSWTFPGGTFVQNLQYEWQVRTYDDGSGGTTPSGWSMSAFFWTTVPVGGSGGPVVPADVELLGSLGCGTHRVFVYDRGGINRIGEIGTFSALTYGRKRDDITSATLTVSGWDQDCGEMLSQLRSMRHEIVVYRNDKRVWEGPITRIEYGKDYVSIEARDVMQYVYRRIMRQGYSDAYPHLVSVIHRAQHIILNALAPDDPNLITYLTTYDFPDDAMESRSRPDYSVTAWEELDDLAANAGLDYTTVGRRIILFDTHRAIGRLPLLRDGDFSDSLIVTEYGMNLATHYAVTDGQGNYGVARGEICGGSYCDPADPTLGYYGLVEILSSSFSETATGDDALTPAGLASLRATLRDQARRNITGRYPAPLVVRVPDNSQLSPDAQIDFDYLVPGVWLPLQATNTLRKVTQWQKLDSVSITADSAGSEKITVVLSPAPQGGDNPDAVSDGGDTGA